MVLIPTVSSVSNVVELYFAPCEDKIKINGGNSNGTGCASLDALKEGKLILAGFILDALQSL